MAAGESRASPCGRDPDGAEEFLGFAALAEEAGGTGPQGLHDVVVDFEGGQDDHADMGEAGVLADHAGGREAVRAGHPDVHEDDVGALLPGQSDRLGAVGRLADHLHVRLRVDEHTERAAQQCLVVGEQDTDRHTGSPVAGVVVIRRRPRPGCGS